MTQFASEPRVDDRREGRGRSSEPGDDAARPRRGARGHLMDGRPHRERWADVGRYLSSIADVTQTSRDWFVGPTGQGTRSHEDARCRTSGSSERTSSSARSSFSSRSGSSPRSSRPAPGGQLHRHPDLPGRHRRRRDAAARSTGRWYLAHGAARCARFSSRPHLGRREHRPRRAGAGRRVPLRLPGSDRALRGHISSLAAGNAAALSRTLVGLGIVQLGVVFFIDLPNFALHAQPRRRERHLRHQRVSARLPPARARRPRRRDRDVRAGHTRGAVRHSSRRRGSSWSCCSPSTERSSHRQSLPLFAVAYMLKGRGRGVLAIGSRLARVRECLLLRRDPHAVPQAGLGRHERCGIADGRM